MKLLLAIICALLLLNTKCLADTPGEVLVGNDLRPSKMRGLNVDDRQLDDYRGKPLIINIWASWCGPCRAEMQSLEKLAGKYDKKQFNLIGISTDDYRKRALGLISQTKITFDNYIDKNLVLENMLGANRIPLTILVDKNGKVLKKFNGSLNWDNPRMIRLIAKIFELDLTEA